MNRSFLIAIIVAGCSIKAYGTAELVMPHQNMLPQQTRKEPMKATNQSLHDAAMERYTSVDNVDSAKETITYILNLQDDDGNRLVNLATPKTYAASIVKLGQLLYGTSVPDDKKIYILEYLKNTSELSNGETQYTEGGGCQDETDVINAANEILNAYLTNK
jgi:hypothetical protein